jgi:hypothetical protein
MKAGASLRFIAVAIVLCGCEGSVGPGGPQGERGAPGQQGPQAKKESKAPLAIWLSEPYARIVPNAAR